MSPRVKTTQTQPFVRVYKPLISIFFNFSSLESSETFEADRTAPGKTLKTKKDGVTKADSLPFANLWILPLQKNFF